MSKNYYLDSSKNPGGFFLRDELHKALVKEEFIVEIPVTEDEIIEIKEKTAPVKLKKVFIQKLNYSDDKSKVEKIWKIDLEKDIPGISTSSGTPECAILVLQKYESSYRLKILLIELKSSIDDEKLEKIRNKFSCAMSRIYMLLVLNNHLNLTKGYSEEEIYIDFKGILFYIKNNLKGEYDREFHEIFNHDSSGSLTCKTILNDQDKIKVKFFCWQDEKTISLQDLLSKN
ncbi:MAG: hypothetical protein AN483_02960 [Aphanizomenon flos-aquae MDT14a]|jgi:hypothetical protein|nr:MAG: hypothetical protein AN483_02960 [Aphanizomenon flos-aquae MDT14a]